MAEENVVSDQVAIVDAWIECETLIVERDGGAVRITLNRPDRLNAFVPQLGIELQMVLEECRDPAVRAVLIRGAGRGFSSGADLSVEIDAPASEVIKTAFNPIFVRIRELEKPVVAAVHGPAAGIGCSLALVCDLVMMAESAYLLLAFANIGLVVDGGASLLVPRRAGGGRALQMALLGEKVPAAQALEWGLVNAVVSDDELANESDALLRRLADGATLALAGIKRELNRTVFSGLAEQLEFEADEQHAAVASDDFADAVVAFASRRPPRFVGR